MKFKNNKGYVGIDASIAVLVLLIIVPTLVGMIYNVNKTNSFIDRKTEAISIAVNTIESAKGILVADLTSEKVKEELSAVDSYADLISDITDSEEVDTSLDKKVLTLTKDENTYKIAIEVQDYASTKEAEDKETATGVKVESGKVKIVKVKVTFKSGEEEEHIELSTAIS